MAAAMETTNQATIPTNSDPVSLAFAVAALQGGEVLPTTVNLLPGALCTVDANGASEKAEHTTHSDLTETEPHDDAEKRLARSRERNREHARKTRMRKKAQLEALQCKVKGLEAERQVLKKNIEECSIASILVGLSTGDSSEKSGGMIEASATGDENASKVALLTGSKRKRFASEVVPDINSQPLKLNIDGRVVVVGVGKSHINWKTGVFTDEDGVKKQLTPHDLETLRRERNRLHAKMTRDRKKSFIATIEKTIEDLETDVSRMRDMLKSLNKSNLIQTVTPVTSPTFSAVESPKLADDGEEEDDEDDDDVDADDDDDLDDSDESVYSQPHGSDRKPPHKRVNHGFSLDD